MIILCKKEEFSLAMRAKESGLSMEDIVELSAAMKERTIEVSEAAMSLGRMEEHRGDLSRGNVRDPQWTRHLMH